MAHGLSWHDVAEAVPWLRRPKRPRVILANASCRPLSLQWKHLAHASAFLRAVGDVGPVWCLHSAREVRLLSSRRLSVATHGVGLHNSITLQQEGRLCQSWEASVR